MTNLLLAADPQLSGYATKAFELGLSDGRKRRAQPRKRHEVMNLILPPNSEFRRFHSAKLRQVYGAGFDIARMTLAVNAASLEAAAK